MRTTRELIIHAAYLTGVRTADIYGPKQHRYLCVIRSAVYVVAQEQGQSYCTIGREIARDHSTIINGCERYTVYTKMYPQLAILTDHLRNGTGGAGCVNIPKPRKPKRTRPPGRPWTNHEVDRVRQLMDRGLSMRQIGASLGRSRHSIRCVRQRIIKAPRPTLEREADRHLLGVE